MARHSNGGRRKHTEENFVGRVFSRWTVIGFDRKDGYTKRWLCQCSCGNVKSIIQMTLVEGSSRSCGCYRNEVCKHLKNATVHGKSKTPIWHSWAGMKNRCYNKNDSGYKHYGERGITVDPSWMSFPNFYSDMGESWFPKATIERKDVNGNYCKDNCIWIPKSRQNCNRRDTQWVVFEGRKVCLPDAARLSGINKGTLRSRVAAGCQPHNLYLKAHSGIPH
jgi:hypothetical protein